MKWPGLIAIRIFLAWPALLLPTAPAKASSPPAEGVSLNPDSSESAPVEKMRAIPFHGVIASVDDRARAFTIAGKQNARSLKITETTVITKVGQPATMKEIVANEEVRGSYYKLADGSLEAKTIKLGPLTEAEKAEKEARREKRDAKKAAVSPTP